MGKKKKADKASAEKLSKKDRRKLAAREAEIRAEIERREAAKKAKKKGKKVDKPAKKSKKAKAERPVDFESMVDAGALGTMTIEAEAPIAPEPVDTDAEDRDAVRPEEEAPEPKKAKGKKSKRDETIDPETGETRPEVIAARKAEREAEQAKMDAEIKARVQAKRARREAEANGVADVKAARMPDAEEGESEVDYQIRKLREKAPSHVAEEVATEEGREFAVGAAKADAEEFAKPSDGTPELEEGRNGYKIIQLDKDGKPDLKADGTPRTVRQMTRVTTFVNNIDDESMLRAWERRLLVEGVSAAADEYVPKVNDLVHNRDLAIAKARKADRKGKLGIGELASLEAAALKTYKDAVNALVEEAMEAAGRHEKADAGTNLHKLAELSDAEGIDAVRALHESGEEFEGAVVSATDLASIESYAERMQRLGAKVVHAEAVIVNDTLGYAGRLDRIIMAKLPELVIGGVVRPADQRARRYVTDIKSGRIDLGAGKIARQLAAYTLGDLYDTKTGDRSRHSAARDVALVFHLPQGAGTCTVHAVDLKAGATLLKLSAEVRRARNTGKKAIDVSVDITDPAPDTEGEA